jgi:MSHA pilin protein MshC
MQAGAVQGPSGFTTIELIVVMIVVSILAVTALPQLTASIGMRDQAWHDGALSALRQARAIAVSHRRVVCLSFSGNSVALSIATSHPPASCNASLPNPGGGSSFAASANTQASTTVTQNGAAYSTPLYFQPDGRVSTDLAGGSTGQWSITMTGASTIVVDGVTGYAR